MTGVSQGARAEVLGRLADLSADQGPDGMAARLVDLRALTASDLVECEEVLAALPHGPSRVRQAAGHLLALGGKRLRPLCVALAARVGAGYGEAARELAISVELVHAATLLHDDVVDLGERRRGAPAARILFGNTASIFAGDYLLIEALRRVQRARVPGAFERLLDVIDEMIEAESLQLERRGRLDVDRGAYFRVVEGKTAALFRWAMFAGGRAGGLGLEQCGALERYGLHLGVAFQAIDDLLDVSGDEQATGKSLLGDVAEGKMTYPLLAGLERDPALGPLLAEVVASARAGGHPPQALLAAVVTSLRRSGSLDECRTMARRRIEMAIDSLVALPDGPATRALAAVAEATVLRDR
jgi:octaprenyl-diphosphate synthase